MSGTNPITKLIKDGMETYQAREAWMEDRVSGNSINAQKIVDERHGPHKPHDYISNSEMRLKPNFRPCPAISSYTGQAKGDNGSFAALRAYQNDFALRRDEILTDIARNGTD